MPYSIPSPAVGDTRVVLVDDDPALRNALTFALKVDGYQVEAFDSAESLLDAPGSKADCLIIDYRLPGRSGLELVEALRDRGVHAPTLLITSHPRAAVKAHAASLGVTVVEKPLLSDELVEAMRGILGFAPS